MTSRTFVMTPAARKRSRPGWLLGSLGAGALVLAAGSMLPMPVSAETTLTAQVGPVMPGRPTLGRALTAPTTGAGGAGGKEAKKPLTAKERRGGGKSTTPATPPAPPAAPAPGAAPAANATGTTTPGIVDSQAEREFNSCHKFPGNRRIVKLNMKPDTELGDLISWISSITCKQFILPGTIPSNSKKVTVVAPQLITPEEAYQLFLAALDSVGLTVQESGKFYRIIETGKAKMGAPLLGTDSEAPPGDRYITRLIRVDHADANELSQVLLRLKTEQGDIIVYPPQGALIITDLESSIDRMLKIVEELDQPTQGEKVWIVRMKNTAASEMAQKLAEIFKVEQLGGKGRGAAATPAGQAAPKRGGGTGVADLAMEMTISKMIPDERSNQLIVIATERAYARLLTLIHKLDVPIEGGDGRIHVYYCENANCDELGQTLTAITGVAITGGGTSRSRRGAAATPTAATPAATGGQLPLLFEGDMRVSFDRPTNSLIILSSLKDYQSLRRVIEKLDSPRKQVFVEAMVMEISLDKTRTLGASFHGGVPNVPIFGKQSLVLGGLDITKTLNPGGLLSGGGDTLLGLAAGVIGPPIPDAAQTLNAPASVASSIPSFGVLVTALQQNNDVNVLSTPHLLIMNNEDGEISVGQNLPFQGASFGGAAGAGSFGGIPLATPVQRTDVALKMKLTPHVNEHDMIRLEVDQEIQDILSPNFNGLGPATSKRSAKTTVVARDQQTIVIGGLSQDRDVEKVVKIPFLGDIPILGFFFRNTTKTIEKTNILIALTPYVITDQADLRRVLEKKLKERREFVERFGKQDVVNPEATIDYRRKRGMLEEINRGVREIEEEEDALQRNREKDSLEEAGALDIPINMHPSGTSMPAGPATPSAPTPTMGPGVPAAPAAPAPTAPANSGAAVLPVPVPVGSPAGAPLPQPPAPEPTPGSTSTTFPGNAITSPPSPTSPPAPSTVAPPAGTAPPVVTIPSGTLPPTQNR
ncbi:MAG TPA: type II secretion system secretin GspD [Polyangia bacterium]|jgi:general secretion pathway protein D